jgi:hypothetical protein
MKKTLLAGAIALSIGVASNASAIVVDVTSMTFDSIVIAASGSMNSNNISSIFNGTFFTAPWVATTQSYYAAGTGANTFSGTSVQGDFSYDFTLTGSQMAFGASIIWGVAQDISIIAIMDCGAAAVGDTCTGVSYSMQPGIFSDQSEEVAFNGVVSQSDVSAVPVPAAVWLFGSGLLGLAGVARCRKAS